jgi:membrane protein
VAVPGADQRLPNNPPPRTAHLDSRMATVSIPSARGWWRITLRTWDEIRADDVFGRSAQLAYYFFLALFPFLICVIASLSVFGMADRGRALLLDFLVRFLPLPAFQLVQTTVDEVIRASGPVKMSFGIVASLWSASLGMGAVMDTLNATYRVTETRSLWKQYAVAIGLTLGLGTMLVASISAGLFVRRVAGILPASLPETIAIRLALWPLILAALLLAFGLTFYFAPNVERRQWHWITPGAVAGILLLIAISRGLKTYLYYFPTYDTTYGSLGAVIVLLLFFYLSGVAVLSGAALNAAIADCSESSQALQPSEFSKP